MREDADLDNAPGGESACYAHLVCPECGALLEDATVCPHEERSLGE